MGIKIDRRELWQLNKLIKRGPGFVEHDPPSPPSYSREHEPIVVRVEDVEYLIGRCFGYSSECIQNQWDYFIKNFNGIKKKEYYFNSLTRDLIRGKSDELFYLEQIMRINETSSHEINEISSHEIVSSDESDEIDEIPIKV